MRIELQMDSGKEIAGRKVQGREKMLYLATVCKRFMDPYVPAMNLVLAQNVRITSTANHGEITYNSPYANYQYEGEVYGPNYPVYKNGELIGFKSPPHKEPTGRKLQYSKFRHPLATSHWDKAMWAARKRDVTTSFENYLRNRG